jgi:hypothetical protein
MIRSNDFITRHLQEQEVLLVLEDILLNVRIVFDLNVKISGMRQNWLMPGF